MNASAPGKVILLGEHAVVYGQPALAAALSRRVSVQVEEGAGAELVLPGPVASPREIVDAAVAIAREAGRRRGFRVLVESEIPLGGGLGSSAALGVALARAFCLEEGRACPPAEAERLALHLERVLHGAPSGVDPAVCARGGVIVFCRAGAGGARAGAARLNPGYGPPHPTGSLSEPSDIPASAQSDARIDRVHAPPFFLVISLTGIARGTRSTVLPLGERRAREPQLYDPLFARLGALTLAGRTALEAADLRALGAHFDQAHGILQTLGVSCAELDEKVERLRAAGALGAKLTGAGGGGAAIGLAAGEESARQIARVVPESFVERIAT